MSILIFVAPKYTSSSLLIVAFLTIVIVALAYLFVIVKHRLLYGKTYVAARAKAETISSWEYTAAEWRQYAHEFEFSKNPQGAAFVRITLLDLWFTDETGTIRLPILSKIMMVTDCRYLSNTLKIRVRYHLESARRDYYNCKDYSIPVPAAKAQEAQKAIAVFEDYIANHPKKLVWVTPPDTRISLFSEVDF